MSSCTVAAIEIINTAVESRTPSCKKVFVPLIQHTDPLIFLSFANYSFDLF